jgi:hypothetical protein
MVKAIGNLTDCWEANFKEAEDAEDDSAAEFFDQ